MNQNPTLQPLSGIAEAILKAESQVKMAEDLGVTQQQISAWLIQGYVSFRRIAEIEARYGVPRARLINPKYLAAICPPQFPSGV